MKLWDYDESVKKTKQVIFKWKTLTVDLAQELWIAREILSTTWKDQQRAADGTFVPMDKTWSSYCKEIGSSKQVVNRWLAQWFPKEKEPKPTRELVNYKEKINSVTQH